MGIRELWDQLTIAVRTIWAQPRFRWFLVGVIVLLFWFLFTIFVTGCTSKVVPVEPAAPTKGTVEPVRIPGLQIRQARLAAPGDTLLYRLTLTGFGPRATGAAFSVVALQPGWRGPVRQTMSTLVSDFELVAPAAWDSAAFLLYAWGTRGSQVSRDSVLIASWKVVRGPGVPPGGTLDSSRVVALAVWPDSAALAFFETQPFCALVYRSATQRWELAAESAGVIGCDAALRDPRYRSVGYIPMQRYRPSVRVASFLRSGAAWTG